METLATPHGPQLLPRCPALFSHTPCKNRAGAPALGEHNEEVCYDFGVDCPPRARVKQTGGAGGSLDPPGPLLEPPGPLLTHLHTVYMAYYEFSSFPFYPLEPPG